MRCKAYTLPPPHGVYICTLHPGTCFGPVEEVVRSPLFVTVLVRGFWINVMRSSTSGYVLFADKLPEDILRQWRERGWRNHTGCRCGVCEVAWMDRGWICPG